MSVASSTDRPSRARRIADLEAEVARHPHRRVPRDLRRRHILELATDLFTERGVEAASMDELAERAGVSKPVVYDLFGSKEGLVVAVIEAMGIELAAAISAAIAGLEDPEDLLRVGSLAFFRFVETRRMAFSMAFGTVRSLPATNRAALATIAAIRERQDALVGAAIEATARARGADPEPLELSAITRGLNGVYEGLVEWWEEHPEVAPEQLTEWVVALVLPGLDAMAGPPGR
jgi:AcrR family transcriptional regulator